MRKTRNTLIDAGLLFLILAPLLLYPLIRLAGLSASGLGGGGGGLFRLWQLAASPEFWQTVGMSLQVALIATLAAGALGVAIAFIFHLAPVRGIGTVLRAMELVVAFPSFLLAFALIYLYGTEGSISVAIEQLLRLDSPPLNFIFSPSGVIFAEATYYLPFMIRPMIAVLSMVNRALYEAGASLGANGFSRVRRIALPLALPGLSAGAMLTFLLIINEFGILLILGSQQTPTVPLAIYNLAMINLDLPDASLYASLMLLFLLLVYGVYRILYRLASARLGKALDRVDDRPVGGTGSGGRRGVLTWFAIGSMGALFVLPILAVILSSVASNWLASVLPQSYTFAWFGQLGGSDWSSLLSTLWVSSAVTILAVVTGFVAGYRVEKGRTVFTPLLDLALTVPMAVPSVVIGLALLLAFHAPPVNLSHSPLIVVLAQWLIVLPTSYRTLAAAISRLPDRYSEAAQALGASPLRALYRIQIPLLFPGIRAATALVFALSAGELGATMMVYPPGFATAPVQIVAYVGRGFYAQGVALAVLMLGMIAVVLVFFAGFSPARMKRWFSDLFRREMRGKQGFEKTEGVM